MGVHVVGRCEPGQGCEFQVNYEGLSVEDVRLLTRLTERRRQASPTVAWRELSLGGRPCVLITWRNALVVARTSFPAVQAVQLLKRVDAGDTLASVLQLARSGRVLACREDANECAQLLRENLEKAVRRQGGLAELLRRSDTLSRTRIRFRRPRRRRACCGCAYL